MSVTTESWTSVDQELCNECGICVIRCPTNYSSENGRIDAHAGVDTCNLCGHCVAMCPEDAIIHHQMDMDNFPAVDLTLKIDPEEFFQFVRGRRSVRHYRNKAIPREDLESLVDLCRYAPTGSNLQSVEILVVEKPDRVKMFSDLCVDYFEEGLAEIEDAAEALRAEGKEIPEELQENLDRLPFRKRIAAARSLGRDPIFHGAPAVMIFHSEKTPSTPKDDCVIAAQTVVLAAMTLKLGTCYIGLFYSPARAYRPVVDELKLPAGHQIGSVLVLGYPKLKFLKSVDRFPMKVRWE